MLPVGLFILLLLLLSILFWEYFQVLPIICINKQCAPSLTKQGMGWPNSPSDEVYQKRIIFYKNPAHNCVKVKSPCPLFLFLFFFFVHFQFARMFLSVKAPVACFWSKLQPFGKLTLLRRCTNSLKHSFSYSGGIH